MLSNNEKLIAVIGLTRKQGGAEPSTLSTWARLNISSQTLQVPRECLWSRRFYEIERTASAFVHVGGMFRYSLYSRGAPATIRARRAQGPPPGFYGPRPIGSTSFLMTLQHRGEGKCLS